jgi:hypothetical protein
VIVPLIAVAGLFSDWYDPFVRSGWTHHPMTFTLTPAVLVLLASPFIGVRIGRSQSRTREAPHN